MMIFLIAASVLAANPRVFINRNAFYSGDTIRVEFPVTSPAIPELVWNKEITHFYRTPEGNWRALVAVKRTVKPGQTFLQVHFPEMEIHHLEGPINFQILPSETQTEKISFSKEKAKLLNDPSEDEEGKEIIAALMKADSDDKQRWEGLFEEPVRGPVISTFGIKRDKQGQKNKDDFHKGMDFKAELGDPVKAPAGAVVLLTKDFHFHGKTVVLSHGHGVGSIYIHLNSIEVQENDVLREGQQLGEVGETGLATGPHLHWGVYVHGIAVNPARWLEEQF